MMKIKFLGRTFDVQQTRQAIGSGISRLEQSASGLETHRSDIRFEESGVKETDGKCLGE